MLSNHLSNSMSFTNRCMSLDHHPTLTAYQVLHRPFRPSDFWNVARTNVHHGWRMFSMTTWDGWLMVGNSTTTIVFSQLSFPSGIGQPFFMGWLKHKPKMAMVAGEWLIADRQEYGYQLDGELRAPHITKNEHVPTARLVIGYVVPWARSSLRYRPTRLRVNQRTHWWVERPKSWLSLVMGCSVGVKGSHHRMVD